MASQQKYSKRCHINIKHGLKKLLASLISGTLRCSIAVFKWPVQCDAWHSFLTTPASPTAWLPLPLHFISFSHFFNHLNWIYTRQSSEVQSWLKQQPTQMGKVKDNTLSSAYQ